MENSDILFEEIQGIGGNIGLITLNRQKALNALTHEMFNLLRGYLDKWSISSNIKAVVVTAAPGRAFCAGGDVRLVYEKKISSDPKLESFFKDEYEINRLIHHYPKPYIALLDGITMGGGAGISIHGSHRIATENMSFAMPETSIGFFPDVGASYFLSKLPFNIGIYLGLTGNIINYDDAFELGLVDIIISQAKKDEVINTLVKNKISDNECVSKLLNKYKLNVSSSNLLKQKELINNCFSYNDVEKIISTLENTNEFGKTTADILKSKSPTSLKVTLKELIKGKDLDFNECMDMEYIIMQKFLASHDFFEGVRALLIDKDKNPNWEPKLLSQVSKSIVAKFFNKKLI